MKMQLRFSQGIKIAFIAAMMLLISSVLLIAYVDSLKMTALHQNQDAQYMARQSARVLAITYSVSAYPGPTNVKQWWFTFNEMTQSIEKLLKNRPQDQNLNLIRSKSTDLSDLFNSLLQSAQTSDRSLSLRRSEILTDRLISEAQQVAEVGYEIARITSEENERFSDIRQLTLQVVIATFALGLFGMLLLIRNKVIAPLKLIEQAASAIRRGQLDSTCGVTANNELGDVAAAIDELAVTLKARLSSLSQSNIKLNSLVAQKEESQALLERTLGELSATAKILESAGRMCGVGGWRLDLRTNEIHWSEQTYHIVQADLSYRPTIENSLKFYEGQARQVIRDALDHAAATGEKVDVELPFITMKGHRIRVKVYGEVQYEQQGDKRVPVSIVGAFQDVTDRHLVESDLRHAKTQAEQASKAKTEFLSNMSHEIRTPLNAIVGLAYMLKQTALNTDQQELLQKLEGASRSLIDLVTGILDLSKIEAGSMELESREFSIYEMFDFLAGVAAGAAAKKQLEFDMSPSADIPERLRGDVGKLRQVLVNLLSNAVKFTETGYVRLSASVESKNGSQCVIKFSVRDSGIGMDEAARSRLFQVFSQGDSSISRRFGGTGIGLALSQKIVGLMNGAITVQSTPGQGSTFEFSVPLELCPEANASGEVTGLPAPAAGYADQMSEAVYSKVCLAGLTILTVDDYPLNLLILSGLLKNHGAQVVQAADGQEALERLADPTQHFDLCLMDVQMPRMNGLEATVEIRERLGLVDLPILALTAGAMLSEHQSALDAGMNAVLTKPLDVDKVIHAVCKWTERSDLSYAAKSPQG